MTASTIDHIVAITIFLAASLLFLNVFSQMIQTATLYQRHRLLASKCSDLIDNILLNTGYPSDWGKLNNTPTIFGLQDPDYTEYILSPFSLMRLNCSTGTPVYYPKTGLSYNNMTLGSGRAFFTPFNQEVAYSKAREMLGINNTYGFQLAVTPTITLSISEIQTSPYLKLAINVSGTGFPLPNATISYCLLTQETGEALYPAYKTQYGNVSTDQQGLSQLNFPDLDTTGKSYALLAYAHISGGAQSLIVGAGCYQHVNYNGNCIIPLISDFWKREIIIAHSFDVYGGDPTIIRYNATYVLLTDDFTLSQIPMENSTGTVNSGTGQPYGTVTIPTDNPGLLIITYKKSASEYGTAMMPWGIGSMAFSVAFGETTLGKEWVATDVRQVVVGVTGYQARLSLWSLQGYTAVS